MYKHISFIIPTYNKDNDTIRRCLDSIPLHDDVQVLVVDDRSPGYYNEKGELRANIVSKLPYYDHPCVDYFFLPKNGGPGTVRNYGLGKAKGEWILFADIDDYYDKSLLESLLGKLAESEADVILFGYNVIKCSSSEVRLNGHKISNSIKALDTQEITKELMEVYPWSRATRLSFIKRNKLHFENTYLSEDRLFCCRALLVAQKVEMYPMPVYNYLIEPTSLSNSRPSIEKIKGAVNIAIQVNKLLKKHNKLDVVRDCTLPKYLSLLYTVNPCLYWIYLLKDAYHTGITSAIRDRKSVCYNLGVHYSLFKQWKEYILTRKQR